MAWKTGKCQKMTQCVKSQKSDEFICRKFSIINLELLFGLLIKRTRFLSNRVESFFLCFTVPSFHKFLLKNILNLLFILSKFKKLYLRFRKPENVNGLCQSNFEPCLSFELVLVVTAALHQR